MRWEKVYRKRSSMIRIGKFAIRNINLHFKAVGMWKGFSGNWYLDKKERVAKFVIEKNATDNVPSWMLTTPQAIKDFFDTDQIIVYLSEKSLYITPYELGQEHLEKALKQEKVI